MANYTADDIKTLSFRDGVRTRIQMYLGSADNEGIYQALKEIINNSTDEALCGYGNKIEIKISEQTNTISIRDYGRGVPFLVKPDGTNILVDVYTKAHTGGKFDAKSYKNASGLNGVGGSCVCLSSTHFIVQSYRDGKCATAKFYQGNLLNYNEKTYTKKDTGTFVEFTPDPEVFKDEKIQYSFARICEDIRSISYLYNGIEFVVTNTDTNQVSRYCAKNGIMDFIKDNLSTPIHSHIITASTVDGEDKMEIAFQWGSKSEQSYVFVNGLRCPEGGSPITGAKTAITRTFNSLTKNNFDGDAIRKNLFYVINCTVSQPSFANQTKSKINNANLRTMASNCFSEALKKMKSVYGAEFDTVAAMLTKIAKAEVAAENARKKVLEATQDIERNTRKKVFASDKLKDAEFLGQDSILLCVEGNSAASSMAMARDVKKYGILALRGKIINCLANDDEDIFENEEVKLLLSALNITPGHYSSKKLRYGKVAICTDSDSDGYHIGLLIMAALRKLAPQFLEEGRLCWLRSPLYIVKNGKTESYYYTDAEMDAVRNKLRGEVQRNKGLGSLSPEQARNSMFSAANQRLDVLIPDATSIQLLEDLMGDDVSKRRNYIFNNVDFTTIHE